LRCLIHLGKNVFNIAKPALLNLSMTKGKNFQESQSFLIFFISLYISPLKVQKYNIHNQSLSLPMMAFQLGTIKV
jgi:hypothetical protein